MSDCYEYVRNYYGVPARVGCRVRHGSKEGTLVRATTSLHYVHIRFDGTKHSVPAHPTDELEYLDTREKHGGDSEGRGEVSEGQR